jgi:hypothetical protein
MNITHFPDGKPGVALLVLRVALGATLFWKSVALFDSGVLMGCIGLISGSLLIIGFSTPIAGLIALGMGILQWPDELSIQSTTLFLFSMVIALATILIGPGALSVDAKLFGRREIIIPNRRQD